MPVPVPGLLSRLAAARLSPLGPRHSCAHSLALHKGSFSERGHGPSRILELVFAVCCCVTLASELRGFNC